MKKVLLVDPVSIPPIVNRTLGYLNYEVASAQHDDPILDRILLDKPELVLIPFDLQGKQGLDVVRAIRKNPIPHIANTPVIIVSDADKMDVVIDQVRQTKQCNVNEFIIDPAKNFGLLIDRITLHINNRVESSWETLPRLPKSILTQTLSTVNTLFKAAEISTLSASEVAHLKQNKNFDEKNFVLLSDGRAISIGKLWNSIPIQKIDSLAHEISTQIVDQENRLNVLLQALRDHDNHNFTHSIHVALYLGLLLKHEQAGYQDFNDHLPQMIIAALLHDIGQVTVNKNLTHKSEALSRDELRLLQGHGWATEKILSSQKGFSKLTAQTASAAHERLDGSGYPHRFDASKLYPSARMIAIIDAYAAMTSKTAYRKPLASAQAFAELRNNAKFDQKIVADFEALIHKMGKLC